jgi:hypothetical protein
MQRPKRKWLVRTLVAISAIIVVLVIYFYWGWRTERRAGEERLAVVMKQLDEQIPGWQTYYEDRNRRLAPKEENSAFDLLRVWNGIPKETKQWLTKGRPESLIRVYPDSKTTHPINQLYPKVVIDELSVRLKGLEQSLTELHKLKTTLPNSGFPYSYELEQTGQLAWVNKMDCIRIARLLEYETWIHLSENRTESAIENVRVVIGISRALGDEPNLMDQHFRRSLCGSAVQSLRRVLACGEPKLGLAELQTELASEAEVPFFQIMLLGESLIHEAFFRRLDSEEVPDLRMRNISEQQSPHQPSMWEKVSWQNGRKDLPRQRALMLDSHRQLLQTASLPWKKRIEQIQVIEENTRNTVRSTQAHFIALYILLDHTYSYLVQEIELRASMRAAVAAIACERFRIAHGRWPNDLAEIPKSILPSVPLDPYDDKPLRLKRTETGLVVYSVGPDLVDHDGKFDVKKAEGWDLGFRLYDPAERRKPAPN